MRESGRTITVAVVDDHEAILDAVRLVLEEQRWIVRTYTTGEAFLADLQIDGELDCLILDPHLPGISGSQVARSLASLAPGVPVIGLTARPNSPVTSAVSAAGIVGLLVKPVTSQQLVESVLAAIGSAFPFM